MPPGGFALFVAARDGSTLPLAEQLISANAEGIDDPEQQRHERKKADCRANELRETVEGYVARASVYEAQGKMDKAANDYRRATELKPLNVFETLAQAESKKKVDQLSKRVPCAKDGTCL